MERERSRVELDWEPPEVSSARDVDGQRLAEGEPVVGEHEVETVDVGHEPLHEAQ